MNERIWGIIGGVALLLALLSPLVLGNSKKVERLFEEAETLYERSNYENAIGKYKEAIKEANKRGSKTGHIDKDFTTLVNLKIAQCYYHLAEKTQDVNYYQEALAYIEKVSSKAYVAGHREELTHLWADILYKIGDLDSAESKFTQLISDFPNSRWIPKALYIIGEINYQQEDKGVALKTFQRLVDEFPHSEFTAKAEQRIKRINELSFSDGTELTNSGTSNSESMPPDVVMYNDATNLKQQGKVHDAEQLYTDLITRFPNSKHVTDAYVGKAEIHLEAENYVKARANYEEAIHKTNDETRRVELYAAYHRSYLTPARLDREKKDKRSDELFIKGLLLRKEGRFLEAANTFEEFTNNSLSTEDVSSGLYWSGRCYHDEAHQNPILANVSLFKESVNAFEKLITDYENSSYTIKTYYYLALAYSTWAEALGDQSKYELVINTVDKAKAQYANNNDSSIHGWLSRMEDLEDNARKKLSIFSPSTEEVEKPTVVNPEDNKELLRR